MIIRGNARSSVHGLRSEATVAPNALIAAIELRMNFQSCAIGFDAAWTARAIASPPRMQAMMLRKRRPIASSFQDFSGSMPRLLLTSDPTAHEADALGHIRHRMVPIVFVFDRNMALEILPLQLIQDAFDIRDAGAVDRIRQLAVDLWTLFQVQADDASLQQFDSIEWFDAGRAPMAGIGACADALIAILHYRQYIIRVPHF